MAKSSRSESYSQASGRQWTWINCVVWKAQPREPIFKVLRSAVPESWRSEKRARRPPPDPLNALLSLGYSLLTQNMITALEIAGSDPYDGFFHADKHGRPALALDLEEEFRSVIVDFGAEL